MCSSAFLSCFRRMHCYGCVYQKVLQFQCLYQIRVPAFIHSFQYEQEFFYILEQYNYQSHVKSVFLPYQTPIFHLDIPKTFIGLVNQLATCHCFTGKNGKENGLQLLVRSFNEYRTNSDNFLPSSNVSCVRKTAALFCITLCMFSLILEVGSEPFEFLNLSSHAIVFSPASFSRGFCFSPAPIE